MADLFFQITLYHYLILSLILFCIGFIGVIVSKNLLKILIFAEFILSSVNINLVAFSTFNDTVALKGYAFSLFYISIGAVETAIALAIFFLMFKKRKSVNINDYEVIKR